MTPIEIMARAYCKSGTMQGVHIDEQCCEERMTAALTALLTDSGWSLVPSEATDEMLDAPERLDMIVASWCYKAMIQAGAYKV
jgi:hypothetical protein